VDRGSWASETRQRDVVALSTRAVPIRFRSSPVGVDSSQLATLPRLPDTAEEIRALAMATNADLARDVFLGARANERTVKTLDLAGYRIVAFATHGLVPGDLDGLTQPALALSAPGSQRERAKKSRATRRFRSPLTCTATSPAPAPTGITSRVWPRRSKRPRRAKTHPPAQPVPAVE